MESCLKKLFFLFVALLSFSHADVINKFPSADLLGKQLPIVDVRTPPEWAETGLLKGAIPIMFFDERGGYNVDKFIQELNEKVDTSKEFAIICRTGSRTKIISNFLAKEFGYKVINLEGGMMFAIGQKLPILPYKK